MFGKEPTIVLGALSEVLRQAIPMLILFGILNWTPEQIAAVMLFWGSLVTLGSIILTRSQVVSHQVANQQIETAVKMPSDTTVAEVVAAAKEDARDQGR